MIYDKLPILVQEFLINSYGLIKYKERYIGKYKHYKSTYIKRLKNEITYNETKQEKELNDFICYTLNNCNYYHNQKGNNLNSMPFISKEVLRNNINKIICSKEIKSNTGGTTGKSLEVYFTKDDFRKRMAYLDAFKEWHGVKLGMKAARFSGKKLIQDNYKGRVFWRTNWIIKQRLYSTFHMSEENLKYYVDNLNKFKPKSLDGFITNIYEIAKYIKKNDIKLEFKPIAIFPTAETVLPHHRELVERVFGCPVRDQYASSEGAPFIIECPKGKLHYCIDTGVIEVVGDDPMKGEIAVTSFTTHGTPLIRYLIGDVIEFSNEKCTCGCNYPIVTQIIGRNTDYLYSKERGIIHAANMSNVIKYLPNAVINIQFIQKNEDEIDINVVFDKEKYKPEYDKSIIDEMKNRFGNNMKFNITKLDEIKREKSGKFRFIINNCNNA